MPHHLLMHTNLSFAFGLAMAYCLCFGVPVNGQEASRSKDRFLAEAPRAWDRYIEFAKRLQGVSVHTSYNGGQPLGTVTQTLRFDVRQCGQCIREVREASGRLASDGLPPAEATVVNTRYAFVLRKQSPTGEWVLVELDTNLQDNKPIDPQKRQKWALHAFCNHLELHGRRFDEMMKDKDFKLKSATALQRGGQQLVRVEFQHQNPPDPMLYQLWITMDGWILVDPKHSWVIKECQVKTTHMGGVAGSIGIVNEYTDNAQGFPIPTSRITRESYSDGQVTREQTTVARFEYFEQGYVPESEFTLSAFGFPEPTELKGPTPWYLWAGVAAAVCLALAFGLGWLARNRTTSRLASS